MPFLMVSFETMKIANTDTNTQLHVTHRQRQILRGMVGGGVGGGSRNGSNQATRE